MTILFNINSNSILFILNIDFFPCDIINHEISPKITVPEGIISKDATSRFGSNENIFPVCQSFETFYLVDSKCLQIKFITISFSSLGAAIFNSPT
jgi:hypothetical protein